MSLRERCVVDLSHYQRPTDMKWGLAIKAGIVGVIVKAGQGDSEVDPAFFDHLHLAKLAGVPLLGAYLFLDDSDPADQAANLIDTASHFFGSLDGALLALDLEANPMGGTETMSAAAEVSDHIYKNLNRRPVLYCGIYGPDGTGSGLPNPTLSKSDLWLPLYSSHLRLPKGFVAPGDNPNKLGGQARLWQQTDGTLNHGTPVPGLGRVDQSSVLGFKTIIELTAWWGH